ncbi:MAG: sugar phosphate isomerase/epimerase [Clostridia bacterium]|nr:sugar phosphate isomerase/epimerase [Clostridia bacterium]
MKLGSNMGIFNCYGEEKYKRMKEFGFDFADVVIDGVLRGMTEKEYSDKILHEKKLADEAGVTIWQAHGPWRYPPHDETEELRAERAEVMRRAIRCAAMIDCKYWVIHPLMPFGPNDDFDTEQFFKINYDFFRALLPTAKENGVTICFENMPMTKLSISSPEKTLEFIRAINDDNFKMCLDTGHCSRLGISPADAVRLAGADMKVMHVHDNLGDHDSHMPMLTGIIDWKAYYDALVEIGFDGVFSLEVGWGDFIRNASNDVKLKALKAIVDDIVK